MAMMFYLQASSNKGNDAYGKALADFRAAHGREKGVDLILIDALLLQKQYAEALASIDRVDAALGGDPYLDVMRANVLLTSGDLEKAKAAARRAVERDPALPEAYWSLLSISLVQNDHAETTRLLETVRDQLEIELADLTTLPDYARYIQTVEYAQFMRSGTQYSQ